MYMMRRVMTLSGVLALLAAVVAMPRAEAQVVQSSNPSSGVSRERFIECIAAFSIMRAEAIISAQPDSARVMGQMLNQSYDRFAALATSKEDLDLMNRQVSRQVDMYRHMGNREGFRFASQVIDSQACVILAVSGR
jgi:hypothetical protein